MSSTINPPPVKTEHPDDESENHEPEGHAVATGVGAVGGGAAGAAVGLAMGGPVGAVIGGAIGAVVGGVGSSAVAEVTESPDESAKYEPLMIPPTHENIAKRARRYSEEDGKTTGHDLENWIRAETDLKHEALAAKGYA